MPSAQAEQLDQAWRYTPDAMIFEQRYEPIQTVRAEPTEDGRTRVIFISASGRTRTRVFDAARITSRLKMAVRGVNRRDEVLMCWRRVPKSDRAGLT